MSDGYSPDSGENSENKPIRYYTLSYSPSHGGPVVRPDGIISNGQEIHNQIRRTTQAFLARQSSSTTAAAAEVPSSSTTRARGTTTAATSTTTTSIARSPLPKSPHHHNHRHSRSEAMSVEGRDLPPRSQPVAVSLPVNMNMRRYISNHLRANRTKPSSPSTSSTCLSSSRRAGSGGDGRGGGSHASNLTQSQRSAPDDHGTIFTMDEDVERERGGAMAEKPSMTQSTTGVTSRESEKSSP